ncbi:PREDICTED: nephrocystin-3-like [Amphimedon queenslandica]|uniref:NACHT domain-containing protein n=1 Tax=Amphimedon queenslandica TaxID=400682 RepID=A0AAN0J4B1_AMPQE|nr:PREDICTED: nephrocystin-3-like [Amphimedon queenslandica]|eukprot:XP_019851854.1 PREDICTED: nephrocystin-3-like [Amphimedon queenslandica]
MEEKREELVTRLRAELRVNKKAYAQLQKEKDDLSKELQEAKTQIAKLTEDIDMKERYFSEYRENKEKEYKELLLIKQDLETRLKIALEVDSDNAADQQKLSMSIGRNQAWLSSSEPQLSSSEAVEMLRGWEGMEGTLKLFQDLLKLEEEKFKWKPGTMWTCKWKPHLKIYITTSGTAFPQINEIIMPELEAMCQASGCSISPIFISITECEEASLEMDAIIELCIQEVSKSDLFICVLPAEISNLTKHEVEYGFLNNPAAKPSIFVFLDTKSSNNLKLRQRVKKLASMTKIMESSSFDAEVIQFVTNEMRQALKSRFDVIDSSDLDQDSLFDHLTLLSDMRVEYEQQDILKALYSQSPDKPAGIEVTFRNLTAYTNDEQTNVAPYLITAPSGIGKSTLLAKWYQHLKEEQAYGDKVEILYHFVTRSCSSSSETCLMYRRFIFKLIALCGEVGIATVPSDPNKLEEVFKQLLDLVSARMNMLGLDMVYILIDNVDQLVEQANISWILRPLPQNIRVLLTANESTDCPDSWRALPVCVLPSLTATDLQEVMKDVSYGTGANEYQLTEDQVISLSIYTPSDPSHLWCILASKFVLSVVPSLSESEVDELIESLDQAEEVSDLVKLMIDDFTNRQSEALGYYIDEILQLIYWSRNGLSLFELTNCISDISVTILLYILSELEKRSIISQLGGLYCFSNEPIQQFVAVKYETDVNHLLQWTDILTGFFANLTRGPLSRSSSELLWLLKRAPGKKIDLTKALLNIDLLIQIYCGGESSLLLRSWKSLGVRTTDICSQYYNELQSWEMKALGDRSALLYTAMLFCTAGKILCNLGLGLHAQPLLQHSLELYESNADPDSVQVGNVMFELASLYTETERFSSAESFYKQALEVFENSCGENSREVLKVLSSLLVLYEEMKRPDLLDTVTPHLYSVKEKNNLLKSNALSLLMKRADELESILTDFDESDVPTQSDILAMNEWCLLHATFGDKKVAEKYLLDNLQQSEDVLGDGHPVTMMLLKNMVTFYQQLKNFNDAIPLQCHIIELRERQCGVDSTSVAAAHNNLAVFYCCTNDYLTAIHHYNVALEIYTKLYGSGHSLVQDTAANRDLAAMQLEPQSL